jgi:EAL domain-containing protein (putative c-di-GMP-specific phosphodiesterase class I)
MLTPTMDAEDIMAYPVLEDYLSRLSGRAGPDARMRRDAQGRATGNYFNATLTSVYQPVRRLVDDLIIGYEGDTRNSDAGGGGDNGDNGATVAGAARESTGNAVNDPGVGLWRLLDHAASDDESVELDRLCRMIHSINFFRQAPPPEAVFDPSLFLSVHARLLTAVDGNHGAAFRRVLKSLQLPQSRVVLQLPEVRPAQYWLLNYVADNYRRNDFSIAIQADGVVSALAMLEQVAAQTVKVDARGFQLDDSAWRLVELCQERGLQLMFQRVRTPEVRDALLALDARSALPIHAQGLLWGAPKATLAVS